jgi:hypothetical protein
VKLMFRRETSIELFADMSQDGYGLMRLKSKKEMVRSQVLRGCCSDWGIRSLENRSLFFSGDALREWKWSKAGESVQPRLTRQFTSQFSFRGFTL